MSVIASNHSPFLKPMAMDDRQATRLMLHRAFCCFFALFVLFYFVDSLPGQDLEASPWQAVFLDVDEADGTGDRSCPSLSHDQPAVSCFSGPIAQFFDRGLLFEAVGAGASRSVPISSATTRAPPAA
ncbi:MAG: hypothetical protein AB1411_06365 [Nitrospirota bacterium]